MSIEQEGAERTFDELLAEEKDGLLAACKEYVEDEVKEEPSILHSSDSLLTIAESRGGDPNLNEWSKLSNEQKQQVKKMFQELVKELHGIWEEQAQEYGEVAPRLEVRDVADGVEVVAVFE